MGLIFPVPTEAEAGAETGTGTYGTNGSVLVLGSVVTVTPGSPKELSFPVFAATQASAKVSMAL